MQLRQSTPTYTALSACSVSRRHLVRAAARAPPRGRRVVSKPAPTKEQSTAPTTAADETAQQEDVLWVHYARKDAMLWKEVYQGEQQEKEDPRRPYGGTISKQPAWGLRAWGHVVRPNPFQSLEPVMQPEAADADQEVTAASDMPCLTFRVLLKPNARRLLLAVCSDDATTARVKLDVQELGEARHVWLMGDLKQVFTSPRALEAAAPGDMTWNNARWLLCSKLKGQRLPDRPPHVDDVPITWLRPQFSSSQHDALEDCTFKLHHSKAPGRMTATGAGITGADGELDLQPQRIKGPKRSSECWLVFAADTHPGPDVYTAAQLVVSMSDKQGRLLDCSGVSVWVEGEVVEQSEDSLACIVRVRRTRKAPAAAAQAAHTRHAGEDGLQEGGSSSSSGSKSGVQTDESLPEFVRVTQSTSGTITDKAAGWMSINLGKPTRVAARIFSWEGYEGDGVPLASTAGSEWWVGYAVHELRKWLLEPDSPKDCERLLRVTVLSTQGRGLQVTCDCRKWRVEGFIPYSTCNSAFTEADAEALVGQEVSVPLLRIDKAGRLLLFGGQPLPLRPESTFSLGKAVSSSVVRVTDAGVAVQLAACHPDTQRTVDGWLPAWRITADPSSAPSPSGIFTVGQDITALIVGHSQRSVQLSTVDLEEQPGDMQRNPQAVYARAAAVSAQLAASATASRDSVQQAAQEEGQELQEHELQQQSLVAALRLHRQQYAAKALDSCLCGTLVDGVVSRLTKYGAFVRMPNGRIALLHISQITNTRLKSPAEVLQIGEKVTALVLQVDKDRGRVTLSTKKLEAQLDMRGAMLTDREAVYARAKQLNPEVWLRWIRIKGMMPKEEEEQPAKDAVRC